MPKLLKRLLSAEFALGVALATLLPILNEGPWKIIASIAAMVPAVLCGAFWLRAPLSYIALLGYCAVASIMGLTFVTIQLLTINSVLFSFANIAMIFEAVLASFLYFVLKTPSSRSWFQHGVVCGYNKPIRRDTVGKTRYN